MQQTGKKSANRSKASGWFGWFAADMAHQFAEILYGCDHEVLDGDFFQASPPCFFEAVVVGRVGKGAFGFIFASGH